MRYDKIIPYTRIFRSAFATSTRLHGWCVHESTNCPSRNPNCEAYHHDIHLQITGAGSPATLCSQLPQNLLLHGTTRSVASHLQVMKNTSLLTERSTISFGLIHSVGEVRRLRTEHLARSFSTQPQPHETSSSSPSSRGGEDPPQQPVIPSRDAHYEGPLSKTHKLLKVNFEII